MKYGEYLRRLSEVSAGLDVTTAAVRIHDTIERAHRECGDRADHVEAALIAVLAVALTTLGTAHALLLEVGRDWPGPCE